MATVTGLTAARMLAIEAGSVIGGNISGGGHLMLSKHDGGIIDAGSVIGPTGPTGPSGATSIAVCTSSTRPTTTGGGRFNGGVIYETDTKFFYVWDGASWLLRTPMIVCTSTSRPTSPVKGLKIYETDTGNELTYQSATTGWTPEWNMPWGQIAQAAVTVGQTGTLTRTDMAGFSITPTLVTGRRYKVSLNVSILQSTSTGTANAYIMVNGADKVNGIHTATAGSYYTFSISASISGYSGAIVIKSQYGTTAGTIGTFVGATNPGLLIVEDIGPTAAPV